MGCDGMGMGWDGMGCNGIEWGWDELLRGLHLGVDIHLQLPWASRGARRPRGRSRLRCWCCPPPITSQVWHVPCPRPLCDLSPSPGPPAWDPPPPQPGSSPDPLLPRDSTENPSRQLQNSPCVRRSAAAAQPPRLEAAVTPKSGHQERPECLGASPKSLRLPASVPGAAEFPRVGFIFTGAFASAAAPGLLAAGIFVVVLAVIMKPAVLNLCTVFGDSGFRGRVGGCPTADPRREDTVCVTSRFGAPSSVGEHLPAPRAWRPAEIRNAPGFFSDPPLGGFDLGCGKGAPFLGRRLVCRDEKKKPI